ncbi:hypothetical protein GCG21_08895 [Pseudactinotalea sp. HY160]|uniref:hypothetical protein n=1 Tax=Pseudactinotalea sp. HY160 TaxID=2654490 RepID=UPI00128CD02D|nr:hypothetical protein [Pseudactinotalea sp. HY160]MPV50121.1 hypothetical protein [Pseudactinotalea sp. HY160]
MDEFLDSLSDDDRRLAEILFGSSQFSGWIGDGEEPLEDLKVFGGDLEDAQSVASALAEHYDYDAGFDLTHEPESGYTGWEVSAPFANTAWLNESYDLSDISDQPEDSTGVDALLGYARQIDSAMQRLRAERDRMRPPSLDQMRSMVRVDELREGEGSVLFLESLDNANDGSKYGPAVQHGQVCSGSWSSAGARLDAPPTMHDDHVKVELTSGEHRFVPLTRFAAMVENRTVAGPYMNQST